ncbi:MAG: VWA domain-containing protein [Phycisphaeraceae bacterium]|nr:VWA domain-containing protein [Phycisphaeraceae bacterium]
MAATAPLPTPPPRPSPAAPAAPGSPSAAARGETNASNSGLPAAGARPGPNANRSERGPRRIGLWQLILGFTLSGSMMAVAVSIMIHLSLALIAAAVGVAVASVGGHREGPRGDYELNIAADVQLSGLLDAPLDTLSPVVSDSELPDVATSGILDGAGGDDRPASGAGLGTIGEGLGGAGGGDIGDGLGLGGGGGGGAASFFGVEAQGSRFAYIVDVSGSMRGEKMAALKIELGESIKAMLEHMSYLVVTFSSESLPLGDRRRWTDATDVGKRWGLEKIVALEAWGNTVPWPAFEIVLAMKPAPDAIYFMTDGIFDPIVADQLAVRNTGSRKVPIHCISFVDRSAEELMRRIAADSGGTYAHVPGPR